jgi:uncharacterized repeat protein (TIGR01451 family)
MGISKRVVALAATAVLAVSTFAVAGALITSSTGSVIKLASPPPSVALNALQHPTSVHAFDERQGVTLTAPLTVNAVNPGTYSNHSGSATIPAGTVVDSHLMHSDPPSQPYTPRRTGSLTFSDIVLGVVSSTARLGGSDAVLGAPGTTYAGTLTFRGLENSEDKYTISPDRKTVSFDVRTTIVIDEIRVVTRAQTNLTTVIADEPDPVTAGNDILYTLTVTNNGTATVANVHVTDTLPAGTALVSSEAPGGCTGTGPVDCALGTLAVGASAEARLVVTSPSTVPEGGTITNSAVATPGTNPTATATTTVEEPEDGVTKGFVSPGGSLTTSGTDPATLSLPNTGDGAAVIITQGSGTFCDGPCTGTATTINDFGGYSDPANPIHVQLVFEFFDADEGDSLTDAADAYGATIYKNTDPENPNVGSVVPFCDTPGAGVAVPHPCIDGHSITQPTPNNFVVTFDILYVSGDPKFARR